MSEFKAKIGKPILISNTNIEEGLDIFKIRVGIYSNYKEGINSPYVFYNFGECHTMAFMKHTGLWLSPLNGIPNRPRQDCMFLLKDVDAYVDYKFNKWWGMYGNSIVPIKDKDSIVNGSYFIKVDTDYVTYFNAGLCRVFEHNGIFKGWVYDGSKDVMFEELSNNSNVYFFTNTELNRLKNDIKMLYRNLNKKYDSKVKSIELTKEGRMLINEKRVV